MNNLLEFIKKVKKNNLENKNYDINMNNKILDLCKNLALKRALTPNKGNGKAYMCAFIIDKNGYYVLRDRDK